MSSLFLIFHKSLSDFNRYPALNHVDPPAHLPDNMRDADLPQENHQGEDTIGIELLSIDGLLDEIKTWKAKVSLGKDVSTTERIVKALTTVEEQLCNQASKRGELKKASHNNDGKGKRIASGTTWTDNKRVQDLPVKIGDKVRILTSRFGKGYAQGLLEYTFGKW